MDKITCNLINCYGIQNFTHEFDFSDTNTIALYARNGLMKTSISKTFKKIQEGKEEDIRDEIFDLQGIADICIDGEKLQSKDVFVIKSFESFYESNSITSLLVNDNVKSRIDKVLKLKDKFLKTLEKCSGLKVSKTSLGKKIYELEPTIVKDFSFIEDSFLLNIEFLNEMQLDFTCGNIKYNNIFNDTVLKKIKSVEFQEKLEDFCMASDRIYESYGFLDKGNFTLPKLKNIAKSLETDKFFIKNNHLYLEGGYEIKKPTDLKERILEVENRIKEVPVFQEIEKMLSDSKGIILKDLLENNPELVSYLKADKLDDLKKQLWLSYIQSNSDKFKELLEEYSELENEINEIDLDDTPWRNALNIFEERFTVPYKMEISNMKGAIIGESIPRIEFLFERDGQTVKMARGELENKDVLSQGEKRALYLLNIIFDIERLKESGREVLFVVDDIADSFDYKNKYAIVEYLYEMSTYENFKLLILSHNFDFYRTVSSRLHLIRKARLCAEMDGNRIILKEEKYQKQPFVTWIKDMNVVNVIALIPFVRNIIEYRSKEPNKDEDYLLLTNLLHEKEKTSKITFKEIENIYKKYLEFDQFKTEIDLDSSVMIKIEEAAEAIKITDTQLEHKIILSIAIRHKAEEYMIKNISQYQGKLTWKVKKKISGKDFISCLKECGNQTRELFNAYKQFGAKEKTKILEEVNIMTPENIHLNSFMYEPILDMDINELLNLYNKIKLI